MSADWARASRFTRSVTASASTVTASSPSEWTPNCVGVPVAGHHVRTGDEGLGRNAVGEHARATGAVGLDDGDVGVQLGGHQRRLVTAPAPRR